VSEKIRERLSELDKEFSEIYRGICDRIRSLEEEVRKGGAPAPERLEQVRRELGRLRTRMVEARLEVRSMLRELLPSVPREEWDDLRESVEEFFERWEDLIEELLDDVRDLSRSVRRLRGAVIVDVGEIVRRSLEEATRGLEASLSKLREALEKGVEGPSYAVSVRLPQRDLEVIDALVEAGVFKSRSEAVAFFAHRGIESAKPLFQEVLSKLEELKALREKLREELRRALEGGEGG